MQNLYDVNASADRAVIGGESADKAAGFYNPRPQAGMRTASTLMAEAKSRMNAAQPVAQKPPSVLGYNPENQTFFSGGQTWNANNLSDVDNYDKAGYLDVDNTGKLPQGYAPVTPNYVRQWKEKKAADRGFFSAAGETGKQAVQGVGDILNTGVQAVAMNAPAGSAVEKYFSEGAKGYEAGAWQPDTYGRGETAKAFIGAGRSLPTSLASGAASFAAPIVGTGIAGYAMGSAQAWDTYQRGLAAGLSPEAAKAAALKTGAIEGAGEAIADRLGLGLLKGAGKAASGMMRGMAPVSHGARVAVDLLANAGLQSGTEYGQSYGEAAVENAAGISNQDPHAAGAEGFKTGLAMSALMAPFGVAGGYANRPREIEPPVGQLPIQQGTPVATSTERGLSVLPPTYDQVTPTGATQPQAMTGLLPAPTQVEPARGAMIVTPGGTVMPTLRQADIGMPGEDVGLPQGAQANIFGNYEQIGSTANQVPQVQEQQVDTPDTATRDMFPQEKVQAEYTPESILSLINPQGRTWKALPELAKDIAEHITDDAYIDKLVEKLNKTGAYRRPLDNDTVEAVNTLVEMYRADRTSALSDERAAMQNTGSPAEVGFNRPGATVGTRPDDARSQDIARHWSDNMLEQETAPDQIYSAPNEMPANLVPEKGTKGPASTLALRGQTQGDLNEMNAREQWTAGPQETQPGPAAIPANQLAMFDRKGQPTNPAMGVPVPVSQPAQPVVGQGAGGSQPTQGAPKRGPKSRRPVTNEDLSAGVAQREAELAATDVTDNVPEEPLNPMQQRMMGQIEKAYEADHIDAADMPELQKLVREGRVPQARARLHEIAVSNKGESGTRFRTSTGTGVSESQIKRAIRAVIRAIGGKIDIIVADSVTDIDPTQKAGSRSGMFKDGKVYVFRDAITSTNDAIRSIFHELFHRGNRLRQADSEYQSAMRRLYNQSAKVRSAANAWMKTEAGVEAKAAANNADEYLALSVDEAMAETAENMADPSVVRVVGRWLAAMADFFGMTQLAQSIRVMGTSTLESFIHETVAMGRGAGGTGSNFRSAQQAAEAAWEPISDKLKYDVLGAAKRGVLSSTFLRHLGDRYASKFSRVKEYVDLVFKMGAKAGTLQKVASDVSTLWQNLNAKERAELSDLMGDVTESQFHMESGNGVLSLKDQAAYDALKARFDALSEGQKSAYRKSRDALKSDWAATAKLLARKADEIYDPLISKAKAAGNVAQAASLTRERNAFVADINGRVNTIKGDYFPLSRFGQWSVVRKSENYERLEAEANRLETALQDLTDRLDQHTADQRKALRKANKNLKESDQMGDYSAADQAKIDAAREKASKARAAVEEAKSDEDSYYVAQFDSQAQAQAHARKSGGYVSHRADNRNKELNGVSRQMLDRMDQALAVQFGSSGQSSAAREAQRSLYQIYLSSLPETSALKRQMKRKNVAGWNKDMHRNVISTLFRNSFYLSRMEFADATNAALHSVRQEADAAAKRGEPGGIDLQGVAAELERRQAASMRYTDTPIQDKVTAMSYLWFLGASPAFLITNLMQPGMVTMPMLQARHGLVASAAAMGRAYSETFRALTASVKAVKEFSIEHSGLKGPHKDLLNYLMENRLLDVTMANDLSTISEGGRTAKWMRLVSNPSHYAELVNRISSGIAAYDLEYARTKDSAVAQQYAAKVISDTHLDYSSENAPYWMKPGVVPLGKVLLQFKKYQMGMIALLVKNGAAAWKGLKPSASPDEIQSAKEAAGTLAGIIATHMAVAGSMGLPAAGTVTTVVSLVAKAFGEEPEDVEAEYRNWLNRTFGKAGGVALAKGIPAMLGVDMSQKAGLGNVINPLSGMRDSGAKHGRDVYLEMLASLAGPAIGGLGSRAFEFADYAAGGEYNRAAASLLPKMLADPLKGARHIEEGVMTRQGRTLGDSGGVPTATLLALGFTPTQVADTFAANAAQHNLKAQLDAMGSSLSRDWMRADAGERRDILRRMPEVNALRAKYQLQPLNLYRYEMMMRRPQFKPAVAATGDFGKEQ